MTSLRHQNIFFGLNNLPCHIFSYSMHREISNNARITSIKVCMQMLCHSEVDFPILTIIIQEDVMSTPIIHGKGASHLIMMRRTLEESIL